jgi:3-hydroxy-3-methylglutaryl CoA synthase
MGDIGITSYGVHIPRYRLDRKTISAAMGWVGGGRLPGEKAVAGHDEDSLTIAVAAARNCTKGHDMAKLDGLFFATTTPPYREKESAAIMATALDMRNDLRTADFTDSLKAGTAAILSAVASVKSGEAGSILLCTADCRLGKPGGTPESMFGDGGAAVTIGNDGVIANLVGSYSLSLDFPDYRRSEADKFVRVGEDRFIREEGYSKFIAEAVVALLKKQNLAAKDIAKVAFPCINIRQHANIGKRIGLEPAQLQASLLTTAGETGTASPVISLAAMLDEAKAGDKLIIASYGNGAEALLFEVTHEIDKFKGKGAVKNALENRKELASYEQYLAFRGVLPYETTAPQNTANTQLHMTWRERRSILALYGTKCKKCGTPQYPPQRICVNPECGAIDEMEDYRFADKTGNLFTYTADHASFILDAPLLYGVIDFNGGGRFVFEFTDTEFESLELGMPVEFVFRRKYNDTERGIAGYFWKAVPIKK